LVSHVVSHLVPWVGVSVICCICSTWQVGLSVIFIPLNNALERAMQRLPLLLAQVSV